MADLRKIIEDLKSLEIVIMGSDEDMKLANEAKLMRMNLLKRYAGNIFGEPTVMSLLGEMAIHNTTESILDDVLRKLHLLADEQSYKASTLEDDCGQLKQKLLTAERRLKESDATEYGKREALESENAALKLELENAKKDKSDALVLLDDSLGDGPIRILDCEELAKAVKKIVHEAEIRGMDKAADYLHRHGLPGGSEIIEDLIKQEKESCP